MPRGFCNLCGSQIAMVTKTVKQSKINANDLLVNQLNESMTQVFTPSERELNGFRCQKKKLDEAKKSKVYKLDSSFRKAMNPPPKILKITKVNQK